MIPLQVVVLLLVAAAGTAVVFCRDLVRMTIVNGFSFLLLVVLFVVFQAPDVALSALVVGAVGYPLVLLAAIARSRSEDDE